MNKNNDKSASVVGTSDMPQPEILNYETYYKVMPVFVHDLKIIMQDVAYADAKPFFDFLINYNYMLPAAILQEYINMLAKMPFNTVSPIMNVINNKNLFPKYFEHITPKPESKPESYKSK